MGEVDTADDKDAEKRYEVRLDPGVRGERGVEELDARRRVGGVSTSDLS